MKQIIMTSPTGYYVVEMDYRLENIFRGYDYNKVRLFWDRVLKTQGEEKTLGEIFEEKSLWDGRTYSIISMSNSSAKWSCIRYSGIKSQWLREGKNIGSGKRSVLDMAKAFRSMGSVPILWGGRFYEVSSGDAEAVLLKYQGMEETEKTELSNEPFEYLKL